jgi:vitamin B12 transporter
MKKNLLVAALITSSHLFAQSDSTKMLDEVTVTASKFPQKSLETGKVVIVISKDEIESSRDLSQAIDQYGGVYINGANSNPGKDKSVYLRGANVEHTLIAIDGIPVYDASGIGSNFDLRNIPVETVERVEVLKGSQGSLYGSDAIAGVINIITKKGVTQKLLTEGSLSYGSYNSLKTAIGFSGSKSNIEYRAGFNHFNTQGISEAAGGSDFDKDGFQQSAADASMGIAANSKIRFNPFFRYSNIKGDLDQDAFTDAKDYTYASRNLQCGIRSEFNLAKGKLKQLYQFTGTKRNYLNDSIDKNINYEINSFSNLRSGEHFAELFYVKPIGKLIATLGSDFRSSTTKQVSFYNYGFGGKPDTVGSAAMKQESIYGSVNYSNHSVTLEGGARYNHHSRYGGNMAFNFNPSWLVNQHYKVFSNISTGYRVPSLWQLYSMFGNRNLKPEESFNIEGGLQFFADENKISFRATYFNRDIKNLIAFYTDSTFRSYYINRDRQKVHGVELDGKVKLNKVDIKVFYSYVNGDIHTNKTGKDTSYFNLYRRPKHSASLTAGYRFGTKFFASVGANYSSPAKDMFFDMLLFQSKQVTLKEHLVLNFYAEYSVMKNKLVLFTDLRNLLDENYQEVYGYNTPGFNLYGGARFKF